MTSKASAYRYLFSKSSQPYLNWLSNCSFHANLRRKFFVQCRTAVTVRFEKFTSYIWDILEGNFRKLSGNCFKNIQNQNEHLINISYIGNWLIKYCNFTLQYINTKELEASIQFFHTSFYMLRNYLVRNNIPLQWSAPTIYGV